MQSLLSANHFFKERNSSENAAFYEGLSDFFQNDDASALLKLRSFALYSPRQTISDFLVRYELFKMIADVPGAIMEFGVYNGQGLMSWTHFSSIFEPYHVCREIFGFDTFDGFRAVTDKDGAAHGDIVKDGGYRVDSIDRIKAAIALADRNRPIGHVEKVFLVEGNVIETLQPFLDANTHVVPALVYLDMDIYEPTKHVLDVLLKRLPKGGLVVFDEFAHRGFPGETQALMDTLNVNDIALKRLPFCSRIAYFVK